MVCFGSLVMGGARMLDSLFSAGQQMIPFLQFGNVCRNSNVQKQHRAIDVFDAVLLLVKPVLERSIYNVKGAGPWITCFSRRFHHRFFHLHKILRDFSWTVWVSVDLGSLLFAAYFSASTCISCGKPLRMGVRWWKMCSKEVKERWGRQLRWFQNKVNISKHHILKHIPTYLLVTKTSPWINATSVGPFQYAPFQNPWVPTNDQLFAL